MTKIRLYFLEMVKPVYPQLFSEKLRTKRAGFSDKFFLVTLKK